MPADPLLEAALTRLPPSCAGEFRRLAKTLLHGPVFQWLLIDAPQDALRQRLIAEIDAIARAAGLRCSRLPLGRAVADVATLETRLGKAAAAAEIVHVLAPTGWFDTQRWDGFNVRRERIAATARARLLFWLDDEALRLASQGAPDLWAWRSGVYRFQDASERRPSVEDMVANLRLTGGSLEMSRSQPIRDWLHAHPDAPTEMRADAELRLGQVLLDEGAAAMALAQFERAEVLLHGLQDERSLALLYRAKAKALSQLGRLAEALQLCMTQELPTWERLGSLVEQSDCLLNTVRLLEALEGPSPALALLRERVLPLQQRLGLSLEQAIGSLEEVRLLGELGQPLPALERLLAEVIPRLETPGPDLRRVELLISALQRQAQLLVDLGRADEALRLLRDRALPLAEQWRSPAPMATTLLAMARLLHARGHVREAQVLARDAQVWAELGSDLALKFQARATLSAWEEASS